MLRKSKDKDEQSQNNHQKLVDLLKAEPASCFVDLEDPMNADFRLSTGLLFKSDRKVIYYELDASDVDVDSTVRQFRQCLRLRENEKAMLESMGKIVGGAYARIIILSSDRPSEVI